MNRTIKTIIAVVFIIVIVVCAVSISRNIAKNAKIDITENKLYTLSDGTKSILGKLNQKLKMKLYYTRTAAMKGPDDIRFFNNYYYFVKSLLDEYVSQSKGMVELEVIDPRPFSQQEESAIKEGVKRIPMSEDESFMFGLVVSTQFGVNKVIPFFEPQRQNFVEYDISYQIDSAITRQKKKVGILSSLPVMGDDTSGYMAQMMMMQGKQPKPAWTIVEQIKQQYEVSQVNTDVNDINDIDILLVIHPKDLPQQMLFAIDQFVLKGGRAVVLVDPYCLADQPDRSQMMSMQPQVNIGASQLNELFQKWGLYMPENKFAGDRALAISASLRQGDLPKKIIGFLDLAGDECFNRDNIISSQLSDVRVVFSGALTESGKTDPNMGTLNKIPIIQTTEKGNTWSVSSPYELMMPDPDKMMSKFYEGTKPVVMGYLVSGKFESAFPEGLELPAADPNDPNSMPTKLTGIKQATEDCAVAVFADVDFITDMLAYSKSFFGAIPQGDNASLLMNAIDSLCGSTDLISIRSKGSVKRDFVKVNEIEAQAAKETSDQEQRINNEIEGFRSELSKIISSDQQDDIIGSEILSKKAELEEKLYKAQMQLREVKNKKRQNIESLKSQLRNFNTLPGPVIILIIAVIVAVRRSARKRHYISHSSDS